MPGLHLALLNLAGDPLVGMHGEENRHLAAKVADEPGARACATWSISRSSAQRRSAISEAQSKPQRRTRQQTLPCGALRAGAFRLPFNGQVEGSSPSRREAVAQLAEQLPGASLARNITNVCPAGAGPMDTGYQ